MIQMHAPPPYSERRQRSHGVLVKFWISITRIVTRTDRSSANLVYEFFQGADFDSNSKDKSPSSTSSTSRLFVNGCDGDLPVRAKNTENDYDDDDNDSDDSENNCGDTFAIPSLTPSYSGSSSSASQSPRPSPSSSSSRFSNIYALIEDVMREQHQQGSQRNVFEPNKTNNRNNRSTCSSVATNATSFCVFADDDGSFTIDGKNRPPVSFGQATPSELTFAPRQSQVHPRRKFNPYHQSSAATQAAHALVASLHKRQEEAPGRDDADFCLFLDVINDTEKDATQTINNNNALTCQCKNGDGTIFWDGATVLLPSWISPDAAMDDDEEADRRKNFLPKSPFAAAAIAAPSNHARTAGALDSFPLPCGYVDHSNKKRYTRVEF